MIELWNDLDGVEDLDGTLVFGDRKRFASRLGDSEPLFCSSCHKKVGFVSFGSKAARICTDCEGIYGGLPLKNTPNISVSCSICSHNPVSIPRELVSNLVYVCTPCDQRMNSKLPLEKVSPQAEKLLGLN